MAAAAAALALGTHANINANNQLLLCRQALNLVCLSLNISGRVCVFVCMCLSDCLSLCVLCCFGAVVGKHMQCTLIRWHRRRPSCLLSKDLVALSLAAYLLAVPRFGSPPWPEPMGRTKQVVLFDSSERERVASRQVRAKRRLCRQPPHKIWPYDCIHRQG